MWEIFFKGVSGSPGDMPSANTKSRNVLPHVQPEEIKEGKISSKQWLIIACDHNWKVAFNVKLNIYNYYIEYFNSENDGYLPQLITRSIVIKNSRSYK
jgi:hypothetical protein